MTKYAHAQPHADKIDPVIAKPVELKRCTDCMALLTVAHFGLAKYSKGGRSGICHECRAQYLRLKRKEKYASTSNIDDSQVRSVQAHNKLIMDALFNTKRTELRAFDVVSKQIYHVHFGPSDRIGLLSLALFTKDGSVFMEWALSGLKDPQSAMLGYLRLHGLRLEWSDMDVCNALSTIYIL